MGMSNQTQTGQSGPWQRDDEYEWDEKNGPSRVIVWEGTRAEIDGLLPTYQVAGYRLQRRQAPGGLSRLEVRAASAMDGTDDTTDAALTIEWELDGSDFEISIYKWMLVRSVPDLLANFIEATINALRADDTKDFAVAISDVRTVAAGQIYDEDDAEAWLLLVKGGVESHRVSNYVVRKTMAAPNAYVSGATLNVGKLYTKTQLLAEHTGVHAVPTGVSADMPSDGYYLKGTTRRRTMGNGKIQIVQEWQHADTFSALQYDLVT